MAEIVETPMHLKSIGRIRTGFEQTDECPSSSRYNPVQSTIELDPAFSEGLRNISLASHLLVLYWLDKADRNALTRHSGSQEASRGVFASRSPNRPNPIGLSAVRLVAHDGNNLLVSGLDCLDGTHVVDIKPYVPEDDRIDDASIGWEGCRGKCAAPLASDHRTVSC